MDRVGAPSLCVQPRNRWRAGTRTTAETGEDLSISGPIITVTAGSEFFDPRILSNLELWLAHFTIPSTDPGEGLSDHWLGAPDLVTPVTAGGSPADIMFTGDGDWLDGTGPPWGQGAGAPGGLSGASFYDETQSFESGFWRWVAGGAGAVCLRDIRGTIVDAGTSTPRTITLAGPLTLVMTISEQFGEGHYLMRGPEGGPTASGIYTPSSDTIEGGLAVVEIAGVDYQVAEGFTATGWPGDGHVTLLMITRDSDDVWHCWGDGVETEATFNAAGDLILTHLAQLGDYTICGFSNILIYSADHSAWAAQMATYFATEFGASAGLEP